MGELYAAAAGQLDKDVVLTKFKRLQVRRETSVRAVILPCAGQYGASSVFSFDIPVGLSGEMALEPSFPRRMVAYRTRISPRAGS